MTAIAGLIDKGRVYIAGDSAGSNSNFNLTVRGDAKVFRNAGYVFGFTTSFRMGQLIRYAFKPPEAPLPHQSEDLMGFMATTFIDSLRSCLKEGGYAEKEKDVERGGTFLVGIGSALFCIESNYQVAIPSVGFDAVGCGADLALGSLHTSAQLDLDPVDRLNRALSAAEQFSAGVRAPFLHVATGEVAA